MRCLSVKQPWAELIRDGVKSIELRTWRTNYRGLIIVCSGASASRSDGASRWPVIGPLGVARALVELVDVRPAVRRDRGAACCVPGDNEYAWVLRCVRRLQPTPVTGQLGLFAPSASLLRVVRRAV